MWKNYKSHKIVQATQILSLSPMQVEGANGLEPFEPNVPDMAKKAAIGDYAVVYADGYKSISPKAAFEDGYSET